MEKRNNAVCQIAIVSLIVLLVVESCLLSENATLFAPVYWIPVALLILIASLSERVGGADSTKQMASAPWRIEFYHIHDSSDCVEVFNYCF